MLTKRAVDRLRYDLDGPGTQVEWDTGNGSLKGFGCRVYPTGRKVFVLKYRTLHGRQRLLTLGEYGELTVEQARDLAEDKKHEVKRGRDPSEEKRRGREAEQRASTVAAFAPLYIEQIRTKGTPGRRGMRPKKTWREDELRLQRHVLPAWGRRKLEEITRTDVRRLHASIAAPYEANRVLSLVSVFFKTAVHLGHLPEDHPNPAHGVAMNAEQARERFVTEAEMPRLTEAIAQEPNEHVRGAFLLYLMTGLRRSELCRLTWSDVDTHARTLRLGVTKNGLPHTLPLSDAAMAVLADLPRLLGNDYVIPSPRLPGRPWNPDELTKKWREVRRRAGIEDVRLHDLRRTVGSWLAMSGASLSLVGAVLNHKSVSTTSIYARYQLDAARSALEEHGAKIAAFVRGSAS